MLRMDAPALEKGGYMYGTRAIALVPKKQRAVGPSVYPPFARAGDQPIGWWWVSSVSCVSIQNHLPAADGLL